MNIRSGLMALALLAASCARQPETGITPGSHDLSFAGKAGVAATNRERYRSHDREAILARMAADTRYADAVEKAGKFVEPLVKKTDGELRALIPPADTKRAFMVHRGGCPVHGGGTAVYQKGLLDRCLRDVLTMNQHVIGTPRKYEMAGRLLLDMEPLRWLF